MVISVLLWFFFFIFVVFFYYPNFFYLLLRSTAKTAHTCVAKTSALAVKSVTKKKTYKVAEIIVRAEKQVGTQKGKEHKITKVFYRLKFFQEPLSDATGILTNPMMNLTSDENSCL